MRSFNCDMNWTLVDMHWESSGFGLGRVLILGGFTIRGKGLYIYIYIFGIYIYIDR